MKKIKLSVLLLPLLITACAQAPKQLQDERAALSQLGMAAEHQQMSQAEKDSAYPKLELTGKMLYTFLLADIAAQRGQTDLATQAYLELAKTTRDVRVVRRAAQLAYETRQLEETLEAFKLWQQLEPQAAQPRQMLAMALVSGGKLEESIPYLVELLAADSKNAGRNFVQLYPLFARYGDKSAVYKILRDLAQPYPQLAQMHWVVAQAAEEAGLHEEALSEVRKARDLHPEWEFPVVLEAQLKLKKSPAEALSGVKKFLGDYPAANEVRLFYARSLLEQKQYLESRLEFQHLLKQKPGNAELAFAIALLSIQLGELDRAEMELTQTLIAGRKDSSTVHYYLGQLHEAKKNNAMALQEYRQVKEGDYLFTSQLRIAFLLVKEGRSKEAREVLQKTIAKNSEQRAQLILTEGQILRDAKQYKDAFRVLSKGLEEQPNHTDMLYEAAMTADKLGKHAVFEKMLRKLIKVSPEHAHAYNALGYSLLERRERLAEAMQLVEKAYQLEPGSAAIMDSMGWGYYLTGNPAKSLEFMRRAYAAFPDPEVAAHLGEVLWQQGAREEAKNIWLENLKKNPDSEALKSVIKKLLP